MPLLPTYCGAIAVRDLGLALALSMSGASIISVLVKLRRLTSRDVALIAGLVGVTLASNYSLLWLPNVKAMDMMVFTSGSVFGPSVGAIVGVLVWSVYGTINPFGFDLVTWLATMSSEMIFGVAGGLRASLRKNHVIATAGGRRYVGEMVEMIAWAVGLTLIYDIATNIVPALVYDLPIVPTLAAGVPFMVFHLSGNILFFSTVGIPLMGTLQKRAGMNRAPRKGED